VPAYEQLDEAFLIRLAGLRQHEHVTVEFQPHRAVRTTASPKPAPDRGKYRPEHLCRPSQRYEQISGGSNGVPSGAWRRSGRARRRHLLHIQLKELRPQIAGHLGESLGIGVFLRQDQDRTSDPNSDLEVPVIIAIVDFDTSTTDRPAALACLDADREEVRAMPGNVAFRIYASREDPQRVTIVHEWDDQASFEGYQKSSSFARFGETIRPLMVGTPVSRRFHAELLTTVN
jgi:quinol monooxygenase YgiN